MVITWHHKLALKAFIAGPERALPWALLRALQAIIVPLDRPGPRLCLQALTRPILVPLHQLCACPGFMRPITRPLIALRVRLACNAILLVQSFPFLVLWAPFATKIPLKCFVRYAPKVRGPIYPASSRQVVV